METAVQEKKGKAQLPETSQNCASTSTSANSEVENRSHPTAPSSLPTPSINRQPSQNQRGERTSNNVVTDPMYQFQIRCVIFLVVAIIIGYMYVQIEHQSIVNRKFQLVPNSYSSMSAKSSAKSSSEKALPPSQSTAEPLEYTSTTQEKIVEKQHGKPMIDPKYEVQAKYLSKVLKTLGDLSRNYELTDNITKPIQGIVEMKSDYSKDDEDSNVPDYMKRLGSIISDIKKSKSKNQEKLKKPTHDYPREIKVGQKPMTVDETDEQEQRWNNFVNELVDAVSKINQENEKGVTDEDERDNDYTYLLKKTTANDDGQYSVIEKVRKVTPAERGDESIIKSNKQSPSNHVKKNSEDYGQSKDLNKDAEITELELDELDFDTELDALEEEIFDGLPDNSKFASPEKKNEGIADEGDQISRQDKIQSRLKLLEKLLEASKKDLETRVSEERTETIDRTDKTTDESRTKTSANNGNVASFQDLLHVLE